MAITSVGYAGTVDDTEWPQVTRYAGGSTYSVAGAADFNATPGVGDRAVSIAAGTAAGGGVVDVSDGPVTLLLPSVSSGSRWDLIGLRRHWATGITTVERVAGGSTKTIPTRPDDPGIEDVQPLWLLRVTAGQTTVQEFVDLRVWVGDGGAYANNDLVRSYMDRVGTSIRIGADSWIRKVGSTGLAEWEREVELPYAMASGASSVSVPGNSGREVTIALPPGRFSVPPNVFLTMGPTATFLGDRQVSVWSRSATEMVVAVSNTSSVSITVPFMWMAVQQTPTTANG